jgi:Phosphoenolpyruvate carboxylase
MSHPTRRENERLSATIRFLGNLLGEVIRNQAGEEAFRLVEQLRTLGKELRNDKPDCADTSLRTLASQMSVTDIQTVIKAFNATFSS